MLQMVAFFHLQKAKKSGKHTAPAETCTSEGEQCSSSQFHIHVPFVLDQLVCCIQLHGECFNHICNSSSIPVNTPQLPPPPQKNKLVFPSFGIKGAYSFCPGLHVLPFVGPQSVNRNSSEDKTCMFKLPVDDFPEDKPCVFKLPVDDFPEDKPCVFKLPVDDFPEDKPCVFKLPVDDFSEGATSAKRSCPEPSTSSSPSTSGAASSFKLTNGTAQHNSKLTNGTAQHNSKLANGSSRESKVTSGGKGDSKLASGSKGGSSKVTSGKEGDSQPAKSCKTIQDDPKASTVYKSLFNTCDKAKRQTQGPWVTYNPQYF